MDRSGNVIAAKSILNSNDNWYLGSISSALGCTDEGAMLYSYQKPLYLGNSSKVRMLINSSGNVTFGSSDLAVTTYKMSVDGKVHIRSTAGASMNEGAGGLIVGNGTVLMIDANDIQAKTDGTTAGPLYINDWGGNVILCGQNKGNVLIGKTDDDGSGAKLQVNGVIKNNNYVITSNGVFVGSSYSDRLTNGLYAGNLMSSALTSADLYLYSSSKLYMYGGGGITMASAVTMSSTLSVSTSVTTPLLKSSGGLDIVANNSGAGSKLFLTTNCFRPWGDDAKLIDLGASTVQWRNVYAVNGIFSGDTSSGSDIRFKDIIDHKTIKIEDIANAPLFTFTWNDREDKTPHLGTSAQYWENVCSELVSGSDFKTLNYASLGVAMGISLAKKAVNHEERIKVLENENKALKEEIRRMQYGS